MKWEAIDINDIAMNDACVDKKHTFTYLDHYMVQFKKPYIQSNVNLYLGMASIEESKANFDPLAWWKEYKFLLPNLSTVCRNYMLTMPSTASIESIFSITDNILGQN